MPTVLAIAVAGALGALARYGVALLAMRLQGGNMQQALHGIGSAAAAETHVAAQFPWATLAVNVLGCFAAGIVMALSIERGIIPPTLRLAVMTGFLGAFTTFSAFGFESIQLIERGELRLALLSIAANLILSLAAVWLGLTLARSSA